MGMIQTSEHNKKLLSDTEYRQNWISSMYRYWREKGLSDDEIQKKIDQELKQKAE